MKAFQERGAEAIYLSLTLPDHKTQRMFTCDLLTKKDMKPHHTSSSNYKSLAAELLIDGAIMFVVMYSMIASTGHAYFNTNNLYMTLMMVAPMALVMLTAMRHMYPNKKLNIALYTGFALVFIIAAYAMRTQALVGDAQFLRAMIPHHSGALLMCREASITDPEIISLCKQIEESQTKEIQQMQELLKRH